MARRVNTKVVGIVTIAAVSVAGGIYAANKLLIKQHPEQFIRLAEDAQKHGNWDEAVADWTKAVSLAPREPDLWESLGNAEHRLGEDNPEVIRQELDVNDWKHALVLNPKFIPAIKSLAEYYHERSRVASSLDVTVPAQARQYAQQVLQFAPDDPYAPQAEENLYTTIIQSWIVGQETDEALVKNTEVKARALLAKHPEFDDLPYFLASLELKRGEVSVAGGAGLSDQPAGATKAFKRAADEIAAGVSSRPKSALLHFYAAQVYRELARVDRSTHEMSAHYLNLAATERNAAIALVKPDDPRYADICVGAADQALSSNDESTGKQIIRAFLKEKGSDPVAVMRVTPLLSQAPEFRPQAMAALQSGLDEGPKTAALSWRRFQLMMSLVGMQLNDLEKAETAARTAALSHAAELDSATTAATDKLRNDIKQNLQILVGSTLVPVAVTKYQAQFALIEHDYIGAIQILSRQMGLNSTLGNSPDLNWQLAQAYFYANERAQAKDYIKKVLDIVPTSVPARLLLVQILNGEGSEDARRQIADQLNYLRRVAPTEPEVILLQMEQLDAVRDKVAMRALFDKLPEDTARNVLVKAQVALNQLKDPDESARMLEVELGRNPGDVPAAMTLAGIYATTNRKPDAMGVVSRALVLNPTNPNLLYIQKQLENVSKDDLDRYKRHLEEIDPNRVGGDLQRANDALASGDYASAEKILKAAETLKPNDKDVLDHFFRLYLITKQWDKIDPYVTKLAAINYDQAHGLLYQFELAKAKNDVAEQMQIARKLTTDLSQFAMSFYCLGQAYQANGQYREAIDNYDTALQMKGVVKDAAVMMRSKIECLDLMEQPDRAMVAIAEGRLRFPDDPAFRLLQIHHEMKYGDPSAAATDLEQLLKDHPDVPDAYLDLSQARMLIVKKRRDLGDLQGAGQMATSARDLMKQAMKRFPDDLRVYKRLSDILSYGGDQAGAEQILQALADRPVWKTDAEPQAMLGQFYQANGLFDKAVGAYAKALSLSTEANKPLIRSRYADVLTSEAKYDQALAVLAPAGPTDIAVGRQRANILVQAGRFAEAETEIKSMLAQNAPDAAVLQTGWAQLELAMGKRDSASEHIDLALAADPKCLQALVERAKLRMLKTPADLIGAMDDLNTARLIKPNDVETLLTMSDVYSAQSNPQEAVRVLQTALRNAPGDMAIRFRLAYLLSNSPPPRLDDAMQVLQDGLGQPGGASNADLSNNIAAVYEQKGDLAGAEKTVADALNRIPGNPILIRSYLRLLSEAKDYQTVVDASTTVLKSKADVWWALQYRGEARAKLGDKAGGLTDLSQALNLVEGGHDFGSANGVIRAIAADIDPSEAIELVKERVAKDPNWQITLMLLYHQQHQDDQTIPLLDSFMAGAEKLPAQQRGSRLQLAAMLYGDALPKPYSDKAYQAYKELLALNPDDVQTLNNFACLCADGFVPPKTNEGIAAVQHAVEILAKRGVSDPLVSDTYGWLLILRGQTSDGMDVIRKALARQTFPEAYYHMGEGYMRMNRPEDAQQQVNLALGEIAKAQQNNRPVGAALRGKVEDLSNRVLNAMRARTSGAVP